MNSLFDERLPRVRVVRVVHAVLVVHVVRVVRAVVAPQERLYAARAIPAIRHLNTPQTINNGF